MNPISDLYAQLREKKSALAVLGLGYVGLPLALAFAKKLHVIGFDINQERIDLMKQGIDPCKELTGEAFQDITIDFTNDIEQLRQARFFIIAVPTPINKNNQPDLKPLKAATKTVAKVLKQGDCVVYESTVYPGCTQEECIPLLEKGSGLVFGQDFRVGYSPERINPGDKKHTLTTTTKIVSGCDAQTLQCVKKVYRLVVSKVHAAPSILVAEAAKIIENTQRDVNIALMNELSILFSRMGINTYDVLEAAGTKWNFLKFYPGLVGGHCIGVDPYYLVYKANELGYHTQVISAGRYVNDTMGGYIAKKIVKQIISLGKPVVGSRVLVMGITFKENVADIRNSRVADIVRELKEYACQVDVIDPLANSEEVENCYGFPLTAQAGSDYDAVVLAVAHDAYKNKQEQEFLDLCGNKPFFVDVKGLYRNKIKKMKYWSL